MLAHEEVERQLVAYDSGQDLKLDTHHLRLFLNYVIFGKLKRGRDYTNEKAHAEEDHRETHWSLLGCELISHIWYLVQLLEEDHSTYDQDRQRAQFLPKQYAIVDRVVPGIWHNKIREAPLDSEAQYCDCSGNVDDNDFCLRAIFLGLADHTAILFLLNIALNLLDTQE